MARPPSFIKTRRAQYRKATLVGRGAWKSPSPVWEMQRNAPVTNPRAFPGASGPVSVGSTRRAPFFHTHAAATDAGWGESSSPHRGAEGGRPAVAATGRPGVARRDSRVFPRFRQGGPWRRRRYPRQAAPRARLRIVQKRCYRIAWLRLLRSPVHPPTLIEKAYLLGLL